MVHFQSVGHSDSQVSVQPLSETKRGKISDQTVRGEEISTGKISDQTVRGEEITTGKISDQTVRGEGISTGKK